jgi:HAD superfamily hydrolase (TIGR01509 family)
MGVYEMGGRMIEALIFDMDGLLIDSEPLAAKAMDAFLAGYGLERRAEVHDRLLGRRLPEAIAIVRDAYAMQHPLDQLIAQYGELRVATLRGALVPMPGARELIAFGREAGLKHALATSGMRAHATISLGETGLTGLFDAEVTGDEVEHGKPAPDLFLAAAAKIGVPPERCVVFEDAPNGVAAAKAAGMRVAAVPNANSAGMPFPVAPDAFLASLLDAPAWLRTLGVGPDVSVSPNGAPSRDTVR